MLRVKYDKPYALLIHLQLLTHMNFIYNTMHTESGFFPKTQIRI